MTAPEKKPPPETCPWCGQMIEYRTNCEGADATLWPDKQLVWLACTNENCPVQPRTIGVETLEQADELWNRRPRIHGGMPAEDLPKVLVQRPGQVITLHDEYVKDLADAAHWMWDQIVDDWTTSSEYQLREKCTMEEGRAIAQQQEERLLFLTALLGPGR